MEAFLEHKKKTKYDYNPGAISVDDPARAYDELHAVMTLLQAMGAQEAISVVQGTSTNKYGKEYARFKFVVNETGIAYDTIEEAVADMKKSSRAGKGVALRSREKNVSSTTPVSVSKRGNGTGSSWSYGGNTVGAIVVGNNDKKKKGSYASRRSVRHGDEEFDEPESMESLEHYGVKGMRWGIHKDPQRAYERANKKLTALDKRATKAGAKASRKETRSLRRQQRADTAWVFPKTKAKLADWAIGRSEKARQKYVKKMSRAVSWYKEMENAFRDTKVQNLNPNYVSLGEKYSKIQVNDVMMNAQASLANKQLRMIYRQMGK